MGKKEITLSNTPPVITDPGRCSGCGRCISACQKRLYTFVNSNRRKHSINKAPEQCALCGRCLIACPLDIIR